MPLLYDSKLLYTCICMVSLLYLYSTQPSFVQYPCAEAVEVKQCHFTMQTTVQLPLWRPVEKSDLLTGQGDHYIHNKKRNPG